MVKTARVQDWGCPGHIPVHFLAGSFFSKPQYFHLWNKNVIFMWLSCGFICIYVKHFEQCLACRKPLIDVGLKTVLRSYRCSNGTYYVCRLLCSAAQGWNNDKAHEWGFTAFRILSPALEVASALHLAVLPLGWVACSPLLGKNSLTAQWSNHRVIFVLGGRE